MSVRVLWPQSQRLVLGPFLFTGYPNWLQCSTVRNGFENCAMSIATQRYLFLLIGWKDIIKFFGKKKKMDFL